MRRTSPIGPSRFSNHGWLHARGRSFRILLASTLLALAVSTIMAVGSLSPAAASVGSVATTRSVVPNAGGAGVQQEDTSSRLNSISCTGSSFCMAVGGYSECNYYCLYGEHTTYPTLAEVWNGTMWSIVPSPGTAAGGLSDVSCTSSTFCMAVGESGPNTLAENWDGTAWSIVASPNANNENSLSSVSCSSPTSCEALGEDSVTLEPPDMGLAESWDGTSWSIVPSVLTGGSVSCTSPTFCMGAGTTFLGGNTNVTYADTDAAVWDGSAWSTIPSPDPDPNTDIFGSVSCTSSTSCIAAGTQGDAFYSSEQTLIESWDGMNWTEDPELPNTGIARVTCLSSPVYCMLVSFGNSSETFDGSNWATIPSPEIGNIRAPSCYSPSDCTAVGSDYGGTIVSSWDGATWTVVPSPNAEAITITASLPSGTVGQAYSGTLSASGGDPPYHLEVVKGEGSLPAGLKLNKATGTISGTPKGASVGTSTFTIQVTDKETKKVGKAPRIQDTATATYSITIAPAG